jgi:hypothetical protein
MRARPFISVGAVISLTLLALPRAAIAQGASRADIQGVIIRQGSFQRYKANALDNASFDIMSQYVHAEDTTGTPGRPDIIWLQFRWADYEQANNHWDATIEGNIRAAAKAACTNGFDIGLTIRAGADAPIGRPGVAGYPSWLTDGSVPGVDVDFVTTWATEKTLDPANYTDTTYHPGSKNDPNQHVRVPLVVPDTGASYDEYMGQYQQMINRLTNVLDDPMSSSDPSCNGSPLGAQVALVTMSAPTELGTEAAIGFGSVGLGSVTTQARADHNAAAWLAKANSYTGSNDDTQNLAWLQDGYGAAWLDTATRQISAFDSSPNGSNLSTYSYQVFAGGPVFGDDWAHADAYVANETHTGKVLIYVKSLGPPASWNGSGGDAFLSNAEAAGFDIGVQASGSIDGQAIVDAFENALARYATPDLFEVTDSRVTDGATKYPSLTWPSGSCSNCLLRNYLYGAVTGSNLASRL